MNLINDDCENYLKKIKEDFFDLTITSPPYDKMRSYSGYSDQWCEKKYKSIIELLFKVTKKGGVVVWVCGDQVINGSETCSSFKQALHFKDCGFNLHDTMIWNKGSFANPSNNRFHQVFEYMFVFSKGKPKTYNEILERKNKYIGKRGASGRDFNGKRKTGFSEVKREFGNLFNIWDISVGGGISYKGKCDHPAVFPEEIARRHIIAWSNEFDQVLDPFMGSGTVGVACNLLKRNFTGIEINKDYFDLSKNRIENKKEQ